MELLSDSAEVVERHSKRDLQREANNMLRKHGLVGNLRQQQFRQAQIVHSEGDVCPVCHSNDRKNKKGNLKPSKEWRTIKGKRKLTLILSCNVCSYKTIPEFEKQV